METMMLYSYLDHHLILEDVVVQLVQVLQLVRLPKVELYSLGLFES